MQFVTRYNVDFRVERRERGEEDKPGIVSYKLTGSSK